MISGICSFFNCCYKSQDDEAQEQDPDVNSITSEIFLEVIKSKPTNENHLSNIFNKMLEEAGKNIPQEEKDEIELMVQRILMKDNSLQETV